MARTYAALVVDWDSSFVETIEPLSSIELLNRYAVHVAVVVDLPLVQLLRQLRPWPRRDGDLLVCSEAGARIDRVSRAGIEVLHERTASAREAAALDRTADDLARLLRRRGLTVDMHPTGQVCRTVTLAADDATAAVRTAGFDALSDIVAATRGAAAARGLPDARIGSDGPRITIGLTDRSDTLRWLLDRWRMQGIGPGLVHVATGSARDVAATLAGQVRRHRPRAPADIDPDPRWCVHLPADPHAERVQESLLALCDGRFGVRGAWEEASDTATPAVLASGVFTDSDEHLLHGPLWTSVSRGSAPRDERVLDLRTGVVVRQRPDGTVLASRFLCRGIPGSGLLRVSSQLTRAEGPALHPPAEIRRVASGTDGQEVEWMVSAAAGQGGRTAGIAVAAVATTGTHSERIVGMVATPDSVPDPLAAVRHALSLARIGHDRLLARTRQRWASAWAGAAIDIPGDPETELAIRFCLFHLLGAAGSPHEGEEMAVGPRGLTGTAGAGHVTWESDALILPALSSLAPQSARAMVNYRLARRGAAGRRFPWESADSGREVTPMSYVLHGRRRSVTAPAHGEHVVADIAWAACFHGRWTGDDDFLRGPAAELVLDAAEYWQHRLDWESDRAHLRGVLGPDEYHDDVDDDSFTVQMAAWCLRRAAEVLEENDDAASFARAQAFREAVRGLMREPDPASGAHEQHAGYFGLVPLTVADIAPPPIALDLVMNPALLAASQAIKQADVLLAHHLLPLVDAEWDSSSLAADLDYYLPRTAHGSSASPGIHAALLARAGRPDEALAWLRTAARIDLDDRHGLAAGGLHLSAMATVWHAVVFGFLGVRITHDGVVLLDPHLPADWSEITVRLRVRGALVHLRVISDEVQVWSDRDLAVRAGDRRVVRMPATP